MCSSIFVTLDVPPVDLAPGIKLEVRTDGLRVGDETVEPAQLGDRLRSAAEMADVLGSPRAILLLVAPEVEAARVVDVLATAQAAGIARVSLVGRSTVARELPPFPDPELGAELTAELGSSTPSDRAMLLAQHISDEIRLCPGATEVFSAVSNVTPDQRCTLVALGLDESLPTCLLTDVDRVLTVVQVALQPLDPMRPTAVVLDLDPAAQALAVAPTVPWRELLPQIARTAGTRWVTVTE